jgi:methylated-DNA-[protein]-cysteine S-methyltransferase
MTASGFAMFDTAIGRCGTAWSERGLVRVLLPEGGDRETGARLRRECPSATETTPPDDVRRAIEQVQALLAGQRTDLSTVPLDMDGVPSFRRRVYEAARAIPPGATLSYGEVAARAGAPGAARAVGQALGRNPFPIVVPCHRVVAADGRMGGFSAPGGVMTKARLLSIEGVVTASHVGRA